VNTIGWGSTVESLVKPILVVDDEEEARGELRDVLEASGHEVIEAANGREALEMLTSGRLREPALILLDLRMPVMTGWEFLTIMRSYHRLSRIPVVVLSGVKNPDPQAEPPLVQRLVKPFNAETLLQTVAQTIQARD